MYFILVVGRGQQKPITELLELLNLSIEERFGIMPQDPLEAFPIDCCMKLVEDVRNEIEKFKVNYNMTFKYVPVFENKLLKWSSHIKHKFVV